ncbi:TPA: EamA family transporter [Proteus mirabilis]|nr:EamA family transporter [Proteus mirabilis]
MLQFNKFTIIGLLSGFFWAIDTILIDYNISSINLFNFTILFSLSIALLHDFFSSIWLLLYIIISKRTNVLIKSLKEKNNYIICLAAVNGGPIGMTCYMLGIYYGNSSIAATISTIYPALGCLFAYIFLKIKTRIINFIGLIIVIISTIYIGLNLESFSQLSLLGFLFSLGCATGWGLESTICSYALKNKLDYNIALLLRQSTSSIIYLIIILFFYKTEIISIINIINSYSLISIIAAIAIFGTISYLFYYKSIDSLGPIKAMGLNISYSAWAILLGSILGYGLSPLLLLISIIIITGSLITNLKTKEDAIIK